MRLAVSGTSVANARAYDFDTGAPLPAGGAFYRDGSYSEPFVDPVTGLQGLIFTGTFVPAVTAPHLPPGRA